MQVTTLNLNYIIRELGHRPENPDDVEGQCKTCGEWVRQDVDACPLGHPISWGNSKIWRDKFLRRAVDPATAYLFKASRTAGFSNGTQYHRWKRVLRSVDRRTIEEKIDYCKKQLTKKGRSTAGTMAYAINLLYAMSMETPEVEQDDNVWTG